MKIFSVFLLLASPATADVVADVAGCSGTLDAASVASGLLEEKHLQVPQLSDKAAALAADFFQAAHLMADEDQIASLRTIRERRIDHWTEQVRDRKVELMASLTALIKESNRCVIDRSGVVTDALSRPKSKI